MLTHIADVIPDVIIDKSTPPPLKSVRPALVSSAVQFLSDGAVKAAPLSTKLAFLEGKGLGKEEIELALLKAEAETKNDHGGSDNNSEQRDGSYKGFLLTSALILGTGSLLLSNYASVKVK